MILLTGFEPFGGDAENPSRLAARAAVDLLVADGVEARFLEVPCVFAQAGPAVIAAARECGADVVICVGVAASRDRISLERIAVNLIDARIPDNAGATPVDVPVVAGAPLARPTRLPVKRGAARVREAGIQVELSLSAGSFVCNTLFYATLEALPAEVSVGFVHVPPLRDIALSEQATALALLAREAMRGGPDLSVAEGRED